MSYGGDGVVSERDDGRSAVEDVPAGAASGVERRRLFAHVLRVHTFELADGAPLPIELRDLARPVAEGREEFTDVADGEDRRVAAHTGQSLRGGHERASDAVALPLVGHRQRTDLGETGGVLL